jgi:hypothetical protein
MRLSQKSKSTLCHCGLDPQSPDNECLFLEGFRVKHGITGFLDNLIFSLFDFLFHRLSIFTGYMYNVTNSFICY